MQKSPAVAYYARKIKTTRRSLLQAEIEDAPLNNNERSFLIDIVAGLSYKELAYKYSLSQSRIAKWKRNVFERMHKYDMQN